MYGALPRASSPRRATRRRSRSTRSRRGACGTAAPRTRSASSTASAGSTRRSPRRRSSPSSATSAASATSSRRRAFATQLIETLADEESDDSAVPADAFAIARACSRSSSSPRCSARCGRSSPGRASRRAASNVRRSRRRGSTGAGPRPARAAQGMAVLIRLAAAGRRRGDRRHLPALCRGQPDQLRGSRAGRGRDGAAHGGDKPAIIRGWLRRRTDALLGYAASSPFRTRPAYRWIVESGHLSRPERRRAAASAESLLPKLIELLERQGYAAAIGAIALPNEASVALHEKLGFFHTGTYRQVGFKMGEWLDVGLWQKELAPREPDARRATAVRLSRRASLGAACRRATRPR